MRTELASRVPQGGGSFSVRKLADSLRLDFPIALREMVVILEPINLVFPLNSGTCAGSCEVNMSSDGSVRYRGNVHDSGGLAATYTAIASLPVLLPPQLREVVIAHRGHVGGTFSFDSRDDSWDMAGNESTIAENWALVKAAAASASVEFGTDAAGLEFADALVNAATALWVFSL